MYTHVLTSEAAWDQAHLLLGASPTPRTLDDFEIVTSGWSTAGLGVAAFGSLVRAKWAEWEEGRGVAAAGRREEERERRRAEAALRAWLEQVRAAPMAW